MRDFRLDAQDFEEFLVQTWSEEHHSQAKPSRAGCSSLADPKETDPAVALINSCRVSDDLFGELAIRTDTGIGLVEVTGETVPRVVLQRAGGAPMNRRVPIGTRRAEELNLFIDGDPAELAPSPGRLTRGSYRVDVAVGETRYQLTPSSTSSSSLRRDAQELGDLWLDLEPGEPSAIWRQDHPVQPQDVALGYALAVAFGTGAERALLVLMQAADRSI